jgi:dipeptidyl aminopeptidase/acylaminoacyl peptidase
MRYLWIFAVITLLVACGPPAEVAQESPSSVPSLPDPTIAATATLAPTLPATASPVPSPTASPTASPTPLPSPTPNPWAEYEQFTIEGLRARSYGEGQIEFVRELERTESFTRHLIAYQSDGLRITGMLNRPHGDGPFPVVLLSHGYYPLDVYQTGNGSKTAADYLARQGFLAIAPDFRSHADSDDAPNIFRAGHVIDLLNLIPLAQALPDAQPGKVGLWGHSNGGAITAKAMAISDQVAAAVVYSPASLNIAEDYEFRMSRSSARAGNPPGRRTGVLDIPSVEFPVTPDQAPDLYLRLSPLLSLHYVSAAVQIHWGCNDEVVPYKWPGDLLAGLQSVGADVEYFEYPGQPHSFTGNDNLLYLQRIATFYAEELN